MFSDNADLSLSPCKLFWKDVDDLCPQMLEFESLSTVSVAGSSYRLSKALDVGKFFFKSSAQNSESNFGERVSSCGNFWE